MEDLLLRRRAISSKQNKEQTYITDGLILMLDGLDRGNEGHWIDKVSSYDFVLGSGAIELNNGIQFDAHAENSWATCNSETLSNLLPAYTSGTIEVCFTPVSGFHDTIRTFFSPDISGKIGAATSSGGGQFFHGASTSKIYIKRSFPKSIGIGVLQRVSANSDRLVQNETLGTGTLSSATIVPNNMNSVAVGGNAVSGNVPKKAMAIVHAIRIYSRKLTEDEMKFNQAIDLIKYS